MVISTQTAQISYTFGDIETVKMIAAAGFDAIDYSMFVIGREGHPINSGKFEAYALELKKTAEQSGAFFNQSHAPFPSYVFGDEDYNKKIFPLLIRSVAVTSIIGAKHVVIHPVAHEDKVFQKEFNMELFGKLAFYCKEYNVKIALENMYGRDKDGKIIPNVCSLPDEFSDYIDSLDPQYFTACLDVGHAGLVGGNAADMIRALGRDRLKALHVHDNDFVTDLHTMPLLQKMNWHEITKALSEIEYDGELTFEADNLFTKFPSDMYGLLLELMMRTGKYLAELVDKA